MTGNARNRKLIFYTCSDFKDLKKGKIESDYIEENYDVIALSEALRVDPFLIYQVYEGITDDPDYLYLPEYGIWALPMPGETLRYAEEYAVAEGYQQAYQRYFDGNGPKVIFVSSAKT